MKQEKEARMRKFLDAFYVNTISPNKKALCAFIAAALAAFLAKHGLSLGMDAQTAFQTFLSGLATAAGVWFATNE